MRAGSIEMEKKERGCGGGGGVSKLVFYARSTGTLTSGRWGWVCGGGGGCRVLRELITTALMKVSWELDS